LIGTVTTQTTRVVVEQLIDAAPQAVWDAVTDWSAQSAWMLGTHVTPGRLDGIGVGGEFVAFTGIGKFGFRDPMVITEWQPPRRCVVTHTGAVVRGIGIIEVLEVPGGGSRLMWIEELELPGGVLGRLAWPAARPVAVWGVRHSLRRLSRVLEGSH
jgi:hypothetical protein